ncbi:MAG: hypothetical protein NUW01_16840 [Gemmatimonadaceae bacterium]|nr:hypothetical protein [Gemmatimonadaceae bacterium]
MSFVLTGGLALAVASRSGHAQATAAEAPASLAGCYELSLGSWSRPLGVNATYHKLPSSVRLDTVGAARGGWVLRPDIAYPYGNRFPGTPRWTATADSVVLTWSNGFQSTLVRVARRRNGDLVGEAVVGSDANEFGNDLPRAAVVARRTACTEGG